MSDTRVRGEEVDHECAYCGVSIHEEPLLECGDKLLCHSCKAEEDAEYDAEAKAAAYEEYYRYGDDSALVAMGEMPSEYDLDPGVRYNDAGEPIGYM